MSNQEQQDNFKKFEEELIELQKKYNIELYAANVAIGTTVGNQEVVPLIKFRVIDKK